MRYNVSTSARIKKNASVGLIFALAVGFSAVNPEVAQAASATVSRDALKGISTFTAANGVANDIEISTTVVGQVEYLVVRDAVGLISVGSGWVLINGHEARTAYVYDDLTINTGDVADEVGYGAGSYSNNVIIDVGAGDDVVIGSQYDVPETIMGGAGDDTLSGGGGNDRIYGDQGNDLIDGGTGNDVFYGGSGSDQFTGGSGSDLVSYYENFRTSGVTVDNDGASGDDGYPAEGDSVGPGVEKITGTWLNDSLTGNNDPNTLNGGGGDDTLNGGDGDDTLNGNDGNDTLYGQNGYDSLSGDANTAAGDTCNVDGTGTSGGGSLNTCEH
ncbi:calcium-binding protein [Streptomyces sp. NPDC055109]